MAPSGFGYYKTITIDHTKVPADLSNFPVLVSLSGDTDLGTRCIQSGSYLGFDVVFTDSTGDTALNFERETFAINGGACTAVFWVKKDLSTGSDTVIRMYYGNASQTTDPQTSNGGTWDDGGNNYYKGVWNLNESGTGAAGNYKDSTSNANNSTNTGSQPSRVAGKISYGQSFNGSQYITFSDANSLDLTTGMTIEVWYYQSSANPYARFVDKGGSAYCFLQGSSNRLRFEGNIGAGSVSYNSTGSYALNQWNHIAVTYNGSNLIFYINGAASGYNNQTGNIGTNTTLLSFGANSGQGNTLVGSLDEIRISSVGRSAQWIATEYANQNDPSAFFTLGAETAASGDEPTTLSLSSTVAGTGSSTATITVTTFQPLASTVSATGLITANIIEYSQVGSSFSGTGLLTSNAALNKIVSSIISGEGLQTSNIIALEQISSSISGTGLETANLIELSQITSSIAGLGLATVNPMEISFISSNVSGSGSETANLILLSSSVNLSSIVVGSGSQTANINEFSFITSSVSGSGSETCNASVNKMISSSVVGSGELTANIIEYAYILSSIVGTGSQTATMNVISNSVDLSSTVVGSGLVTAIPLTHNYISSNVAGSGAISATISLNQSISSDVSGSGSSSANATILEIISSMVAGIGLSLANMTIIIPDKIDLAYPLTVSIYQNLRTVLIYQKKWTVTII
jgi:hypothetical protein